jgi:DNA-binding PadR family transcriptional regulator
MTASRLLILGALRQIQPAHGYQVRQELERWEADKWATIAYGSIYHALNSMAEEGLLEMRVELERKGGTTKKTYTLTHDGEKEYKHLLAEYWWEPKSAHDPFQIALVFAQDMPRKEYVAAIEMRKGIALEAIQYLQEQQKAGREHMRAAVTLRISQLTVFVKWADEQISQYN